MRWLEGVIAIEAVTCEIGDGSIEVTVHTDYAGPDFLDEETGIHMQTHDFRVSFNEARLASPS